MVMPTSCHLQDLHHGDHHSEYNQFGILNIENIIYLNKKALKTISFSFIP